MRAPHRVTARELAHRVVVGEDAQDLHGDAEGRGVGPGVPCTRSMTQRCKRAQSLPGLAVYMWTHSKGCQPA
jgi:hypothetical protein